MEYNFSSMFLNEIQNFTVWGGFHSKEELSHERVWKKTTQYLKFLVKQIFNE